MELFHSEDDFDNLSESSFLVSIVVLNGYNYMYLLITAIISLDVSIILKFVSSFMYLQNVSIGELSTHLPLADIEGVSLAQVL